jgi:thiol-disulfide isomerase/thioredoxin
MKRTLPYILIIIALLIAGGIYIDKTSPKSSLMPKAQSSTQISSNPAMPIKLDNLGPAPDFAGITRWLNSDPLTINSLKGKVVLVDFWTYSCINCIRTLPYVTKWYDTYHDKGFVVVGVHTPEFAFEKDTGNVARAIQQFGIHYPVAQDNNYGTWNAYNNSYWPAEYLIDQNGNIVHTHFGEGEYDQTEDAIRELLGMNTPVAKNDGPDLSKVGSPEMYFGTNRLENLDASQKPSDSATVYHAPATLKLNTFALDGQWLFDGEKATLASGPGKIKLHFSSGKVHFVAMADHPITVKISVDGQARPDVTISASQLYTLFDSNDYTDHVLEISIPDAGLEAFTFTFG